MYIGKLIAEVCLNSHLRLEFVIRHVQLAGPAYRLWNR